MNRRASVKHQFVESVPQTIDDGVLYVSIKYATAVHKCCCGCGIEVVTPLTPTDWELTFDGESVSLGPSIGNWSFPCQSHYWIIRNRVKWARRWTRREIEAGRSDDKSAKNEYFDSRADGTVSRSKNQNTVQTAKGTSEKT
jgi:hypothetical protein